MWSAYLSSIKLGRLLHVWHSPFIFHVEAYEFLAKGDGNDVSATQILHLGKSFKEGECSGAFKIGQRYVPFTAQPLLMRKDDCYCVGKEKF